MMSNNNTLIIIVRTNAIRYPSYPHMNMQYLRTIKERRGFLGVSSGTASELLRFGRESCAGKAENGRFAVAGESCSFSDTYSKTLPATTHPQFLPSLLAVAFSSICKREIRRNYNADQLVIS